MSDVLIDGHLDWSLSGSTPELGQNDVHVWFAELDHADATVEHLRETICTEERDRAMRFRFRHDRQRFIVARAVLRAILGRYLDIDPRQVLFQYGEFGKPSLAGELEESQLQFNVSHSGNGALYAVSKGRKVGCDVESIRPLADMRSLAESCFSMSENTTLETYPEQERLRGFFDGWTRKEAFLKATGYGLSLSTKAFEVSLTPGVGKRELIVPESTNDQLVWLLLSLAPRPEFSAAVVIEGKDCRVTCAEWIADTEHGSGSASGTNQGES